MCDYFKERNSKFYKGMLFLVDSYHIFIVTPFFTAVDYHSFYASATKRLGIGLLVGWLVAFNTNLKFFCRLWLGNSTDYEKGSA